MRFHRINARGGFYNQRYVTNPAYISRDEGRQIYNQTDDQLYLGVDRTDIEDFVAIFDAGHDILPETASQYTVGGIGSEFLAMYSDEFVGDVTGDVTGDVAGNLVGDVYASNGTDKILEAGSAITAQDAVFKGTIWSLNVGPCLDPNSTPSAAVFTGTSTKAKYA